MQKHVNLVDLVKSFPTNIYLQNLASMQKRTSPLKFAHLAEKSGKGSISNLSTKVHGAPRLHGGRLGPAEAVPRRESGRDGGGGAQAVSDEGGGGGVGALRYGASPPEGLPLARRREGKDHPYEGCEGCSPRRGWPR